MPRLHTRTLLATVALVLGAACGSGTEPPLPATLVANSSTTLSATVDAQVAERPSVKVLDASGAPVSGVPVTFSVPKGHGAATTVEQVTNAAGVATVGTWQLDSVAGMNTMTVTSGALPPLTFTATGLAGPPRYISVPITNPPKAPVASTLSSGVAIEVRDVFRNPVPGAPVTFSIYAGGGSLTGASQVTNAAGLASPGGWTLGTTVGMNMLSATVHDVGTIYLSATATNGPAVALVSNALETAKATVGTTMVYPPGVMAVDAYGNPVSGVPVSFTVTGGGGSATGTTSTTADFGTASAGTWVIGTVAGLNTMQATSGTLRGTTVSVIGIPDTPAIVEKVAGDAQTGTVGTTLPVALTVVVKDKYGNITANAEVYFVAVAQHMIMGPPVLTDKNGLASSRWTLSDVVGTQTLNASSWMGYTTFSATAMP